MRRVLGAIIWNYFFWNSETGKDTFYLSNNSSTVGIVKFRKLKITTKIIHYNYVVLTS
jgi:hypothetical protein